FAAVTAISITLSCLAYPDPLAALLGCIAFTTLGAFLAFFHSTRAVLGFVFVAAVVATSQALEVAMHGRA
ncbi:GGDEF domain-containing protein, partial [Mycobacterium sp. ITM-2017-0098]